jgi:hypothetical protein
MDQEQGIPFTKLLHVKGGQFCGGIMFHKVNDKWHVFSMPPYLKKVLRNTPVNKIGEVLTSKGFKWYWSHEKRIF